jgi:hypothetical protein
MVYGIPTASHRDLLIFIQNRASVVVFPFGNPKFQAEEKVVGFLLAGYATGVRFLVAFQRWQVSIVSTAGEGQSTQQREKENQFSHRSICS